MCGYSGDGGKGTAAQLYYPAGVALDSSGNLFIADTSNCRVRKVVISSNTISTYAGNGTCGYTGDGALATGAEVNSPNGVVADSSGNLFIADTNNYVIREVTKSSLKISTVAGNHTYGHTGDSGPATSAELTYVYSLAVSGTTVTIADNSNYRVRQFTVGGNISTVAGTGSAGICWDAGKATAACFNQPTGVAISGSNIYVADQYNYRIRLFTVGGNINTVAGNGPTTIPTLLTGEAPQGVVFNYPFRVEETLPETFLLMTPAMPWFESL